jgi:hypothetical protein
VAAQARPKNGYHFTDATGNVAYLWWEPAGPLVEAEEPALRRRVRRALKRPIWIVEDEPDEFGVQWSTRKHIQPDDPRYLAHWFWSLGQVGLGKLARAEVVGRETKKRVWPVGRIDGPPHRRIRVSEANANARLVHRMPVAGHLPANAASWSARAHGRRSLEASSARGALG